MKKISIIVPVYKVEPYVEKCLQSLLNQDLPADDYEIICINDGSPDKSPEIIRGFAQKHSNVILLDQENKGVSAARNNGIEHATGEYLFFVDADDSLHPNCLNALYEHSKTNTIDLLYVRADIIEPDGSVNGKLLMEDADGLILDGFKHYRRGFIFGLYDRKTVGDLRFFSGIPVGEDALFNIMMHAQSRRITYTDIPAYKYLTREGSASRAANLASDSIFLGNMKAFELLVGYFNANRKNYTPDQVAWFDRPFAKLAENILLGSIIPILSAKRLQMLKTFLKKNNLDYLNGRIAEKAKHFDRSSFSFLAYHRARRLYAKLGLD